MRINGVAVYPRSMAILSIQSRVTSGYVGNSAAVPILQRLNQVVWPIDTVAFSNHPAHGAFRGNVRPSTEVADLAKGIDERGLLPACTALLSGYLGSVETGPVVYEIASRVRSASPKAFWCCDPVMGDNGRFYVSEGLPAFFRNQAVPAADIVTPNAFEAAYLAGMDIVAVGDAVLAAQKIGTSGPEMVVVTGIREGDSIASIAVAGHEVWCARAPFVNIPAHGAGDAFVALFIGHLLRGIDTGRALALAVSGIHELLMASVSANDLLLIETLDRVVAPTLAIDAERLA